MMAVFFAAITIFDGWIDGSLTAAAEDKSIQGTILCVLVAVLIILAQREFTRLAAARQLKIFTPVAIIASLLLAGTWYVVQLIDIPLHLYLFFLSAFSLLTIIVYQYLHYGTSATIANCGANYFSIAYIGLFSGFVLAIRIDFGLWPLLMFISVIKFADIGAYAIGSSLGRHKFSPNISPGKTWEGMAGAVIAATLVAVLFAVGCDIISVWPAIIFGFCLAFIGQAGDLVESMIKRDAEQKDSANHVPGFGGILDIVDSPLVAAPFAYLFFMIANAQ
jgi:phosphatidate cytidylyltransferase